MALAQTLTSQPKQEPTYSFPRGTDRQAELLLEIVRQAESEVRSGTPADVFLAGLYRDHREYGSRDRRMFSAMVFSWFRWRGWMKPFELPLVDAAVAGFLLDADDVPGAVLLLAGRTALRLPKDLPGLGGSMLADKATALADWTGKPAPAARAVLPEWVWNAGVLPDGLDEMLLAESMQGRVPTWIRVRQPMLSAVHAALSKVGLPVVEHECLPTAMRFTGHVSLRQFPELTGKVEVQDVASQAVAVACAPTPGGSWWDVCSGSGGKALHLADLMNDQGKILATEVRRSSVDENRRRVAAARLRSVEVRDWDGSSDVWPERMFNGVLVDAPCSGMGTWHRSPDARWRLGVDAAMKYPGLQRRILELAAPKVRPRGVLVYSTCTFAREENEGQVEAFLTRHPEFILDPFNDPLTGKPTSGMLMILPWTCSGNGMFIARLKRRGEIRES